MLICSDLILNSIDYIVIIDRDFNIIFNARYEPQVNDKAQFIERREYFNRNLFEIYPGIDRKESSFVKSIVSGEIVVKRGQWIKDFKGKELCTDNITIPIIREGIIMGALELSKDITTAESSYSSREEKDSAFHEIEQAISDGSENITFDKILTRNKEMISAIEKAKLLAELPNPTLIYGETGTGKELFAQAMISQSTKSRAKVVTQNCAAIPDNLFESILFGTSKGAYTGADNNKGLFEEADGGIIFLDELNSIPYDVQGKLLRIIQDGTFRKLGSNEEKKVNVKIIASMNVDPIEAMENSIIRRDLFYRFSSSMLYIPALRERQDDYDLYIDYYMTVFNKIYNKNVSKIDERLMNLIHEYSWEGNVREFKHFMESMVATSDSDTLGIKDVPKYIYNKVRGIETDVKESEQNIIDGHQFSLGAALEEKEKEYITNALNATSWNIKRAGELLGIPRTTLNYRIGKLGIKRND